VWYSNSTDATLRADEALTAQETLTQRVHPTTGVPYRGLYQASTTVAFPAEGLYSLAVAGITSTTGTTAFEVVPNVDTRVTVEGLRDTITAGEMLPAFTVRYFDASGNPTDNNVGRVMYARAGGSSTATIAMMRSGEGVYAVSATRATIAGTYVINVQGINKANVTGNKDFVVMPAPALTATFETSTSPMTKSGSQVTLIVTYQDQYGNLSDNTSAWKFASTDIEGSTGTLSLTRKSGQPVGVFTTQFRVYTPGGYRLDVEDTEDAEIAVRRVQNPLIEEDFNVLPGPARRMKWVGVQTPINPGTLQAPTVEMFDALNAPTNYWDGTLTAVASGVENKTIAFTQPDKIDQYGEPLYPLNYLNITPVPFTVQGSTTLEMRLVDANNPSVNIPTKWQTGVRTFRVLNSSLTLSSAVLDFGEVNIGETAVLSYTFTVQNLTVGNVAISAPAGYTIRKGTTGVFSQTLTIDRGETTQPITIQVQFTPTQNGRAVKF
jgi:hypothetical protein